MVRPISSMKGRVPAGAAVFETQAEQANAASAITAKKSERRPPANLCLERRDGHRYLFDLIDLCPRKRKAPADPSAFWVEQELDSMVLPRALPSRAKSVSARNTLRAGLLT